MKREDILALGANDEERMLLARVFDLAMRCEKIQRPTFSGFLNLHEAALCSRAAERIGVSYLLWGGYEGAERRVLCCYDALPPEEWEYPIAVIHTKAYEDSLTHRDYLGSLLALGVKRECIGDIVVCGKEGYLLCSEQISAYLLENWDRAGRCSISCCLHDGEIPVLEEQVTEKRMTVPSLRCDCLIGAAYGLSRSAAAELVAKGAAQRNWEAVKSGSSMAEEGDVFSVKGYGRATLAQVGSLTKKGRIPVVFHYKK